jgi:hypothetical protein
MGPMFRQYNYPKGSSGAGVGSYFSIFQERPNPFIAFIHTRMKSNYFRVSRLVLLPYYHGIGVGKRL